MNCPTKTQETKKQTSLKKDEKILVVKRTALFPDGAWHGMKSVPFNEYLEIIKKKQLFMWRSQVEEDPQYKQIIPYLVFTYHGSYFLMQRKSTSSEKRLSNKFSLGIGGHIRQEDLHGKTIFDWAEREFHEEIEYHDTFTIQPLGILNDDSNAVGKVHIGFIFLLDGNSNKIKIKSELKQGNLVPLAKCRKYVDRMESWSQIVFAFLNKTV
ncbi:hypothetical protein E3J79_01090 [Candidatus Dependentiae bacterium]|nr:MAG: hypothetical protein E3J79_01090 [Candidatus Dependentiae bacterium]